MVEYSHDEQPPTDGKVMKDYHTVEDVARKLCVARRTVLKWIGSGRLKAIGENGNRRVKDSTLRDFMEEFGLRDHEV